MEKMMTAKTYTNWERGKSFEKDGKFYVNVKCSCNRCGGTGIYAIGVENGQIKPHPAYGGICLACSGSGFISKEVRLYTEEEYVRMEATNERARQKKEAEREAKMKAEFTENERKWKLQNGWSEDGVSYIVSGDSYSIKDELKEAGFIFDPVMRWHKATKEEKYADRLIEVHLDELCDISAWGKGTYRTDAKSIVDAKLAAVQPESTSEWIFGKVGDKIKDIKVQLIKKYSFETRYGYSTVYTFQDESKNILVWFSSTAQNCEIGDWIKIKYGTIKKLDIYNNIKQTIITRCKLVE